MAKKPVQTPYDRDRAFMLTPDKWPRGYVLCLKRSVSGQRHPFDEEFGLLVAGTWTVTHWPLTTIDILCTVVDPAMPRYTYADVDALMADGWLVD